MGYEDDIFFRIGVTEHPETAARLQALAQRVIDTKKKIDSAQISVGGSSADKIKTPPRQPDVSGVNRISKAYGSVESTASKASASVTEMQKTISELESSIGGAATGSEKFVSGLREIVTWQVKLANAYRNGPDPKEALADQVQANLSINQSLLSQYDAVVDVNKVLSETIDIKKELDSIKNPDVASVKSQTEAQKDLTEAVKQTSAAKKVNRDATEEEHAAFQRHWEARQKLGSAPERQEPVADVKGPTVDLAAEAAKQEAILAKQASRLASLKKKAWEELSRKDALYEKAGMPPLSLDELRKSVKDFELIEDETLRMMIAKRQERFRKAKELKEPPVISAPPIQRPAPVQNLSNNVKVDIEQTIELLAQELESIQEINSKLDENASKKKPAYESILNDVKQAGDGVTRFAEGLAYLGLASKSSNEELIKGFLKIKGGFNAVIGMGKAAVNVASIFGKLGQSSSIAAERQDLLAEKASRTRNVLNAYSTIIKAAASSMGTLTAAEKKQIDSLTVLISKLSQASAAEAKLAGAQSQRARSSSSSASSGSLLGRIKSSIGSAIGGSLGGSVGGDYGGLIGSIIGDHLTSDAIRNLKYPTRGKVFGGISKAGGSARFLAGSAAVRSGAVVAGGGGSVAGGAAAGAASAGALAAVLAAGAAGWVNFFTGTFDKQIRKSAFSAATSLSENFGLFGGGTTIRRGIRTDIAGLKSDARSSIASVREQRDSELASVEGVGNQIKISARREIVERLRGLQKTSHDAYIAQGRQDYENAILNSDPRGLGRDVHEAKIELTKRQTAGAIQESQYEKEVSGLNLDDARKRAESLDKQIKAKQEALSEKSSKVDSAEQESLQKRLDNALKKVKDVNNRISKNGTEDFDDIKDLEDAKKEIKDASEKLNQVKGNNLNDADRNRIDDDLSKLQEDRRKAISNLEDAKAAAGIADQKLYQAEKTQIEEVMNLEKERAKQLKERVRDGRIAFSQLNESQQQLSESAFKKAKAQEESGKEIDLTVDEAADLRKIGSAKARRLADQADLKRVKNNEVLEDAYSEEKDDINQSEKNIGERNARLKNLKEKFGDINGDGVTASLNVAILDGEKTKNAVLQQLDAEVASFTANLERIIRERFQLLETQISNRATQEIQPKVKEGTDSDKSWSSWWSGQKVVSESEKAMFGQGT